MLYVTPQVHSEGTMHICPGIMHSWTKYAQSVKIYMISYLGSEEQNFAPAEKVRITEGGGVLLF